MASRECESEVVRRRVSRIASHVAGCEGSEVPARRHSQLLPTVNPKQLPLLIVIQNCDLGPVGLSQIGAKSGTLNSVKRRCDNRLLFARQSSASQACFMQQVSAAQGLSVGGIQQNSPTSRSSCSRNGPPCYESTFGDPSFARPAQAIPHMPNLKKQQPKPQEYVESSAEPPRFARPGSGVCEKNNLSCNRTEQTVRSQGREWSPRMDVAEAGQYYIVMLELPGANVIDIKVEVNDRNLIVRGKHSAPRLRMENGSGNSNMAYIQRGIFQGPYSVVWPLPSDVDKDSVSAELLNGFLQITVPKICGRKADAKM